MTAPADTAELLLRQIEASVARARTAANAEHWELVALNLAAVQWSALSLVENLQPRLANRDTSMEQIA